MGQSKAGVDPTQHLQSLRQHVLGPLSTARRNVTRERREVERERRAFEEFAERVRDIEAAVDEPQPPSKRSLFFERRSEKGRRVRRAYRETVMAVDHFEEVYAESLTENVAMEFGPEFAEVVDPESPAAFTRPIKVALVGAAKRRVQERKTFETTIGSEAAAVETARCELDEMVGGLADPVLPSWYRPEFAERLEEIARTRQSTIRTRRSVPRADGHDLCAYLYEDEDWTYPVLTAVTRLRDSVVI